MYGCFSLPTGDVELKLKDSKGVYWQSVMFTDSLYKSDIAELMEDWSKNHKILDIRYNGKPVTPPKKWHWILEYKGEVFGTYATKAEAETAMKERRMRQRNGEKIRAGFPKFVEDK